MVVAVQNDREWARLATQVLRRPELAGDPRFAAASARTAHRDEVTAICAAVMNRLTLEEAIEALDVAGVACGRVNYPEELIAHPQLAARDRWRDVDSPGGLVRGLLPPPVSDGWELRMDRIPDVGEDTGAVLAGLGYGAAEIDRLIADGVVSEPSADRRADTDSERHADR